MKQFGQEWVATRTPSAADADGTVLGGFLAAFTERVSSCDGRSLTCEAPAFDGVGLGSDVGDDRDPQGH